jgi:hypothetical protein
MSTKCSMYWDGVIHIYQECFDEENIIIERSDPKSSIKMELELKQIISLVRCFDYESMKKQAYLTDEYITNHVTSTVDSRNRDPISMISEMLVYGDVDGLREDQINNGIKYYTDKRNFLKKIVDEIESTNRKWAFNFGLEEII